MSLTNSMETLYTYLKQYHADELKHLKAPVVLFLSIGFKQQRATILTSNGTTFRKSWENLLDNVDTFHNKNTSPDHLKIDWITGTEKVSIHHFIQLMTSTKKNYFRKGISFDKQFEQAFLEQEINANAFIKHDKKNKRGYLDERNMQFYIQKHRPQMDPLQFNDVRFITLFEINSVFFDGSTCYSLISDEKNNGRRANELDKKEVEYLIKGGQSYLTALNQPSGKFIYGYFSCFDKEIQHYNMLRHSSTLYSMIETYELFPDQALKGAIDRGLAYLASSGIYRNKGNQSAYVIDGSTPNEEVKLGANAAAILALTKYTEIFQDPTHIPLAKELAKGMLSLQQADGSFHHVLYYPSLELKEAHRIVYYDGEAAFAFMRLYAIDQNKTWLDAVENAFDYFIKQDHWKHHDHWLSYCTNELTAYRPLEKYFLFGLKNVQDKLPFIHRRITTYPTFLELTLAANQMVERMKQGGHQHLLEEFDETYLMEVIHHRAEYQRNGFFYPELAMYYKNPSRIINGFFIRHHSFRTRIDDVEHYLSGYVHYYKLLCR